MSEVQEADRLDEVDDGEPVKVWQPSYNEALRAAIANLPSNTSISALADEASSDEDILGFNREQQDQPTITIAPGPALLEDEGLRQRSKSSASKQSRRSSVSSNDSAEFYLSYRRQNLKGPKASEPQTPPFSPLRYQLLRNVKRGSKELIQFDDWDNGIANTLLEADQGYWLDIQKPTVTDMHLLAKRLPIDDNIISAILSNEFQEQASFLDQLLHVCIQITAEPADDKGFLIMLILPKVLITFHNEPLLSVRFVMEGVKRNHEAINPDRILYLLLLENLKLLTPIVHAAEDDVELLHDLTASLGTADKDDVLVRISSTRNQISKIQRRFLGKRDVLRSISSNAFPFLAVSSQPYLRDTLKQLNELLKTIALTRDSLNQLQANYLAKVGMEFADQNRDTNRSMKAFALLATVMTPVNGLSGIGGMNLYYPGNVGVTDSPQAFTLFIFAKIFLALTILFVFKYMKLV